MRRPGEGLRVLKLAALARELLSLEPQQRRDVAKKLRAFAVTAAEAPDGFLAAHVLDLVARCLD